MIESQRTAEHISTNNGTSNVLNTTLERYPNKLHKYINRTFDVPLFVEIP